MRLESSAHLNRNGCWPLSLKIIMNNALLTILKKAEIPIDYVWI